jgi:hypothetical protein
MSIARITELAIGFDEGTLDLDELGEFADLLVRTGLVNSTGTYQRFVRDWRASGDES